MGRCPCTCACCRNCDSCCEGCCTCCKGCECKSCTCCHVHKKGCNCTCDCCKNCDCCCSECCTCACTDCHCGDCTCCHKCDCNCCCCRDCHCSGPCTCCRDCHCKNCTCCHSKKSVKKVQKKSGCTCVKKEQKSDTDTEVSIVKGALSIVIKTGKKVTKTNCCSCCDNCECKKCENPCTCKYPGINRLCSGGKSKCC